MKTFIVPAFVVVYANTQEEADAAAANFQTEANRTAGSHLSRPPVLLLDEEDGTVECNPGWIETSSLTGRVTLRRRTIRR